MKRTPLKRTNPKRRAKTFARNFGPRGEAVREMECLAVPALKEWSANGCPEVEEAPRPCWGDIQAAHLDGARQGGGHGPGTARGLGPLCAGHHAEAGERRGSKREEFEDRYCVDLRVEVERIAVALDRRGLA